MVAWSPSLARQQWWGGAAAASMAGALLGFAAKLQLGPLAPGDVLHVGVALGLWLYAGWVRTLLAPGRGRAATLAAR